jgi:hypothetical protein
MDQMRPCCDALVLRVIDIEGNELMGQNVCLFAAPKDLSLSQDAVVTIKSIVLKESIAEITIHSDKIVLYVVLSTGVQGQFEDNAFAMQAGEEKVSPNERF